MRAAIPGLATPYPIGTLMPAIYQEDQATMAWTAGLDDVLAPVISTLDCLSAYLDPMLAPEDFVLWLADWFGAVLDENWPAYRRRAAVRRSVSLYRQAGTLAGLRALLELVTGGEVELVESGGVAWSRAPNAPLPGSPEALVVIWLAAGADAQLDLNAINELVAAVKPAHVAHRMEVSEHDRLS
ncbi:MAG TPA: phage tail protein [Streptosporangiaceae bacterium]|jgi:phage tail-like protein|nr:phage tail protein [Streptosporangiaceae bacterium]